MTEAGFPITDAMVDAAVEAGRHRRTREFSAIAMRYDAGRDALEIDLRQGFGLRVPRAAVAELATVPADALATDQAASTPRRVANRRLTGDRLTFLICQRVTFQLCVYMLCDA